MYTIFFNISYLLPPHKITHPEKVEELRQHMMRYGWVGQPLIGYYYNSRIQLLSGTHRLAAAKLALMSKVPVVLRTPEQMGKAWGDVDLWKRLMEPNDALRGC